MSAVILFAVLVALTPPLAWLAQRRVRREVARWRFRQQIRGLQRAVDETARVIGEAFIPAMQQAAQALSRFTAAFAAASREDGKGATNE